MIQARPPSVYDLGWRFAYRVAHRLIWSWRRWRRVRTEGASVAVRTRDALLLVETSYRRQPGLPGGGIDTGELPEAAARRELREEVGITAPDGALQGLGLFRSWDGGVWGHVHLFEWRLERLPPLRVDGREIVAARAVQAGELNPRRLDLITRRYLRLFARDLLTTRC